MSRWVVVLVVLLVVGLVGSAHALSGSGTQEEPWLIQSLEDFNDFAADANYWDDYTRLETDVNLAGRIYTTAVIAPDVNNANWGHDGPAFTGVFDGNDHKITGLNIDDGGAGNNYVGLFGSFDEGEVRNLGLEGGSISGDEFVGGLVGGNWDGSVLNCYSTASVVGQMCLGGLVGLNLGSISNCYSIGDVNGIRDVGGLVGENEATLSNCYSTGDVTGDLYVGGLVGYNGYNSSVSANCYSTSDVSGIHDVGGLVGENEGGVSNCYFSGDVNGLDDVGGLVGINRNNVSNCFWDTDIQTHGVTENIGDNEGTATNVFGLPTSQLKQQSTFTDWDFIHTWNIGENQTYPYLRVFLTGDINHDRIVNFLDFCIIANQWMNEE